MIKSALRWEHATQLDGDNQKTKKDIFHSAPFTPAGQLQVHVLTAAHVLSYSLCWRGATFCSEPFAANESSSQGSCDVPHSG